MSATDKPEIAFIDDREAENGSDSEKGPVVRTIDNMRVLGLSDDDTEFYANFTPEQRKATTRKVRASIYQYDAQEPDKRLGRLSFGSHACDSVPCIAS